MMKQFLVLLSIALGFANAGNSAFAAGGQATVALVGDVMLAETEGPGRLVAEGGDPLAGVRSMLATAHLRVANFESSAGTQGRPDAAKPFSFRSSATAVANFASVFEAAALANNHVGDFGRGDVAETVAVLRKAGVQTFGGGVDQREAHRAAMFVRNGIRIAILGYLDFLPRWFAAAPGLPGVAWLDPNQAGLDIAKARRDGADVVLVMPHWGVEHEHLANSHQRGVARKLIDAGADAVIGGHPHVVQDAEIYRGKPILYSLGNFVFDGFVDEDNVTGWVVFIDLDKRGVRTLETRLVRMDSQGSPTPEVSKGLPCWRRGDSSLSACQ